MSHYTDIWASLASRVKPSSTFQTETIANATATSDVPTYNEICQRTGFKQLPEWHPLSDFTTDGYGEWVRRKSADAQHPQDFVGQVESEMGEGPQFAEPDNTFLSTSISAEDL
jgi:hypothetical protein